MKKKNNFFLDCIAYWRRILPSDLYLQSCLSFSRVISKSKSLHKVDKEKQCFSFYTGSLYNILEMGIPSHFFDLIKEICGSFTLVSRTLAH